MIDIKIGFNKRKDNIIKEIDIAATTIEVRLFFSIFIFYKAVANL